MRLLIVDDEPLIRSGIREDLASMHSIDVADECGSVKEAIRFLREEEVDLVLLDIRLPDGTGFDVVTKIGPEQMPPIIFVTAYDTHAIQAFEVNAIDYLLKPFDEARLKASIQRALMRVSNPETIITQLREVMSHRPSQWAKRLVIRDGERIDFVSVTAVDWIETANNFVILHCGAKTYILSETMTNLEQRLDPEVFLRIHRSRLINVTRLIALHAMPGGVFEAELATGTKLLTGRQFKERIQSLISS